MPESFAFRLKRFMLAVDIVDDDIYREMWGVILTYISKHLTPQYHALLVENAEMKEQAVLTAIECTNHPRPVVVLSKSDEPYGGLADYAYRECRRLWIVEPKGGVLHPKALLRDDWSGAADLPRYDRSEQQGIRTMILLPIQPEGRRPMGLLDLQSTDHHEITPRAKTELIDLGVTIAELLQLRDVNHARKSHTLQAIALHNTALAEEQWPAMTKPQIFVASSDRADEVVMAVIRRVLDGFRERVRVHYWKESSDSGNINVALLKQIRNSQFGLCYFSEPAPSKGGPAYRDNANVVFEAGMMQALTGTDGMGWIPIRERDSPSAPVDFAHEHTIFIERLGSDFRPNLDALSADLKARLERMLA